MASVPVVLTIGDHRRQEFLAVMGWLRRRARVIRCRSPQQFLASPGEPSAQPVLVVWLQSFGGEFSTSEGDAVCRKLPGVQSVCVYAALAEGETRTGKPLPGVERFPCYSWAGRLKRLWRVVGHDRSPLREQAIHWASHAASGRQHVRVGVYSGAREMQAVLCESLCCLGYNAAAYFPPPACGDHAVDSAPDRSPQPTCDCDLVIWEESRDPRAVMLDVGELVKVAAPRPVAAIVSFPRWQDVKRLNDSGVSCLIGKPFQLAELTAYLDGLAGQLAARSVSK